ncbi:MAG: radical SAM protein [Thermoanaerobaculia bacterium]|nr:radical SAM protein [Thermoanaerobaculia bacterium]
MRKDDLDIRLLETAKVISDSGQRGTPPHEVSDHYGQWKGHDYWLLSTDDRPPFILFAPTLRLALLISPTAFKGMSRGATPSSIEARFKAALPKAAVPVAPPPTAFHLGIGLTRDCTLACLYCHAEADKPSLANWTILQSAFEHAVAAAARTPRRILSVSFAVGGEPTMPWHLFTESVNELQRLVRKSGSGVERLLLSMTTNGYFGADRRNFIAANFNHLTISLDGDEPIQDLHRPNRGRGSSYAVVAETIRHFLAVSNIRLGIRGTVSAESVDRLPKIVEHFAQEFGTGLVVAFEPLVPMGRALTGSGLHPPDMALFTASYRQARAVGKRLGIHVTSSAPSLRRLVARYCGAMSIPSFTVCIDGKITACHRDQEGTDYGYGTIGAESGEILIDRSRLDHVARQNVVPGACRTCFARWHCAGDCPDIRRIGWSRCGLNRVLLHDEIVELLSREEGGEHHG